MPEVMVAGSTGEFRGYLATPEGREPWPGVMVIHDVLGMTTDLKRITDRFAASGYLALAPDLYDAGDGSKLQCLIRTVRSHFTGHGAAYANLLAAREHLISDRRCNGRVGLAGFCMGGGFCLQLAPSGLFGAAAPNYALLPKDVDKLEKSCPVVASFGANDRIVATDTAARLEAVLTRGGVPHDVKQYSGVGHSFMNQHALPSPLRVVANIAGLAYSAPEADDAWSRILSFFREHLVVADRDSGESGNG